jgi:hypothetical protein
MKLQMAKQAGASEIAIPFAQYFPGCAEHYSR